MNRAQRRSNVSYARELAKLPWQRLELKALTIVEIECFESLGDFEDAYVNNVVSVQVYRRDTGWGLVTHLAVRRHDEQEIAGWDLLQRVKNEVAGENAIAVEVYPKKSELKDLAPMRHLFVLPVGFVLPLTIHGRWE